MTVGISNSEGFDLAFSDHECPGGCGARNVTDCICPAGVSRIQLRADRAVAAFRLFDAHTETCSACGHGDHCLEGRTLRGHWLALESR